MVLEFKNSTIDHDGSRLGLLVRYQYQKKKYYCAFLRFVVLVIANFEKNEMFMFSYNQAIFSSI